jgi:response regulator RpfG family c-di-GMP phosphodiesterase
MKDRKYSILCVDDEPLNLSLLEAILVPRGYEVFCVSNGSDALETISRERVDLLLLDVMMPEMNGFEVCCRIKADHRFRSIPVIMITAHAAKENRIRGIEAGAEDFISKPFDISEVLARIGMLIRVKSLNDRLDSAYQNITNLARVAEEIIPTFDPLHFDFMGNITRIIRQVIATSADMPDHPQMILVGVRGEDGSGKWYRYGCNGRELAIDPLVADLDRFLGQPAAEPTIRFYNKSDPFEHELAGFAAFLADLSLEPDNIVVCLCGVLSICALNYGREVTVYDAEVLNSVVAQSLFLKSLSSQVRETEDAFAYTVRALARASEANDEDTGNHILRVGEYGALLARQLGMPEKFIDFIRLQSQVHDVGKIHVPPEILKKPGLLDPNEYEIMKQHTIVGAKILGEHVRLSLAAEIALTHHERWDGSGYPRGLKENQIPFSGRITSLADQYDALRNPRAYKPAYDHQTTCRILLQGDGRTMPQHFDPSVLSAFKVLAGRFEEVYEKLFA